MSSGAHGPGERDLRRELAERVDLDRRRFLGLMAGGAGMLVLGACTNGNAGGGNGTDDDGGRDGAPTTTAPADVPGAQGVTADPFTLGIASGDPLPTSVILWTRLVTDPLAADGAGGMDATDVQVLWEVATDDTFDEVVASGIEVATPTFGHSVHADATGLDPDTWYCYRFRLGDHVSPVGRTRTTPAEDAAVEELRIAFASCQLRSGGYWTAYEHMANDDLDLVFHLGDYIYEYPAPDGEGVLAVPIEHQPETLEEYRLVYGVYKRDPLIQAVHAKAPWLVTWDDHEVQNNHAAGVPQHAEDEPGFADRRRAAYQAYWEHQPLRLGPPEDDGLQLYRSFRYGTLASFFVLDGRQYRSDQVCGDTIPTDRATCPEIDDPDNTMLGDEQESWLIEGLAEADTTWKGLAQQTVMKALVLGDLVLNVDQWDGYPAARARLLASLAENQVENVMVMTGDIHVSGAAELRGTDAGPEGPIVAHELVVPGISSPSLVAGIEEALDIDSFRLTHHNLTDNGYARATITPETWTTEWIIVDTVSEPGSDARVDATVEVRAGEPGMHLL